MTSAATKHRLIVWGIGTEWPYISLAESQVADVRRVLDTAGVRYEVDELAVSLDGEPEVTRINFRRGTDGAAVQKLLDLAQ